ncbi:MAG TPA: hypothetical protein VJA82_02170 [Sediminibacterium sp.]|uniref:hypothetical protein n=1 Tax=Sediminibacterium sp. TaxID=1917865 RepID=UPI0008BD9820|nr:hypothetical protein [Sediminibacterium sp.]OHC84123.1 MAG: hypothetical protein A2472_13600 [Sphingobacteriia bacterium RIFOXYC2_FULL_35_18]OHC87830.1 MAG: hypothetical protein A2546_05570 [Sphingobacteriia bacterium RIFOXYD2_FULL_35_12]HLD52086.1 hypothetical protein [Sediminibacterium sp.]
MELFSGAWWDNYKSMISHSNENTKDAYKYLNQKWLLHVINRNVTRDEYREILEQNNIKHTENYKGFKFREILEITDGNKVIKLFPDVLVLIGEENFSQSLTFTSGNIEDAKIIQEIFIRSDSWKMVTASSRKTELSNIDKTISVFFSESFGGEFYDKEEYDIYFKFHEEMPHLIEGSDKYLNSIIHSEKAIETTPEDIGDYPFKIFWLQMNIVHCYMKLEQWVKAYSIISKLILPSRDYKYHRDINKAEVLIKLGTVEFADLLVYELIHDISPKNGEDYFRLSELYNLKLKIDIILNKDEECLNEDREKISECLCLMIEK